MTKKITDNRKIIYSIMAIVCSIILIAVDQLTKYYAIQNIRTMDIPDITVIKGVFRLTYLENRGAAWGILPDMQMFFVLSCLVLLVFIFYYYWKIPYGKKYIPLRIVAVLLTAGAVGNMIDRVFRGYVVDFFEFIFISFPVFNVADIYVSISAALIIILILFLYKEEDINFIKKKAGKTDC